MPCLVEWELRSFFLAALVMIFLANTHTGNTGFHCRICRRDCWMLCYYLTPHGISTTLANTDIVLIAGEGAGFKCGHVFRKEALPSILVEGFNKGERWQFKASFGGKLVDVFKLPLIVIGDHLFPYSRERLSVGGHTIKG